MRKVLLHGLTLLLGFAMGATTLWGYAVMRGSQPTSQGSGPRPGKGLDAKAQLPGAKKPLEH